MQHTKSNLAVPQSEIVQDTLAATFSRDFCGDFNGCGRKSPAVPAAGAAVPGGGAGHFQYRLTSLQQQVPKNSFLTVVQVTGEYVPSFYCTGCTGCTEYRVYWLYWVQGTLKIVLLLLVSLTDNYCEELGSPVAATSYIQSHHEQFLRFHNGVKTFLLLHLYALQNFIKETPILHLS